MNMHERSNSPDTEAAKAALATLRAWAERGGRHRQGGRRGKRGHRSLIEQIMAGAAQDRLIDQPPVVVDAECQQHLAFDPQALCGARIMAATLQEF